MGSQLISFRVSGRLGDWLTRRHRLSAAGWSGWSLSEYARQELVAFADLQAQALQRVDLTVAELNLLADVCSGDLPDLGTATSTPLMAMSLADAVHGEDVGLYGGKWDVDERALLAKISRWDPLTDLAVRYALAAWWQGVHEPTAVGWHRVGLRPRLPINGAPEVGAVSLGQRPDDDASTHTGE